MKMKLLFLFCLLSGLVPLESSSHYDFPQADSIKASIAGSFLKRPKSIESHDYEIKPAKRKRKELKIRYYPGTDQHLVFVLAGIGEYEDAKVANNLALPLLDRGHHVVIFPSVFTEMFAQSFSSTGYVGFLPADAADMLEAFSVAKDHIQEDQRLFFHSSSVVGYSLGALTAAHMQKSSPFEKVVLINPPIDLLHGLKFLDQAALKGKKPTIWNTLFGRYTPLRDISFHNKTIDQLEEENFKRYVRKLENVRQNDLTSLIGHLLKTSLSGVVLASQEAYDLDIFQTISKGSFDFSELIRRRSDQAKKVSFQEYAKDYLSRFYREVLGREDFSLEKMNHLSSLYNLERELLSHQNLFLIHNRDDFLLKNEDQMYLEKAFGPRLLFFPRGGHLGNLWHAPTVEQIFDFIY